MLFACFLFTPYHNIIILVSSIFGVFAVLGIFRTLLLTNFGFQKFGATLCLLLLAFNNYVYYSSQYLAILPILQKVTLLFVLMWVLSLNAALNKPKYN